MRLYSQYEAMTQVDKYQIAIIAAMVGFKKLGESPGQP